jgi:hypothetical protein
MQTNSASKIFLGGGVYKKWADGNVAGSMDYTLYFQLKISNRFTVSSRTNYEKLTDNNQYITNRPGSPATRYIVGKIDRNTLFTTLRAEYFVTPELSLQYYGSPYASTGRYRELYKVKESYARDPQTRYTLLDNMGIVNNRLYLDEDHNGKADFTIAYPDFNFQEFRSNFVLRWEYKAGSTVYLVWSHQRSENEILYDTTASIGDSFKGITGIKPENLFMVKLSYWLSL